MSHLTRKDRCIIENLLNAGETVQAIARKLGRPHTTIAREIRNHMSWDDTERGRYANYCKRRDKCIKSNLCKAPPPQCQGKCNRCRVASCNELCNDFVEDHCNRLERTPHVCNGCKHLKDCRKRKLYYRALAAEGEYHKDLSETRRGIDASAAEIQKYADIIQRGTALGQSLHHIMTAHLDSLQKCEKTLYNYIRQCKINLGEVSMPRMKIRTPRTEKTVYHKVDPQCRVGRSYADYLGFMALYPELVAVQMDSVIGRRGGKVLLTLHFPCGLMLACLRDTNDSQSVLDYFNMLEREFGLEKFKGLFPVILTDNGSEFSNPHAIETSPVALERRTKVFFCEPGSAWQKGSIENNHTNLRRILPKGSSFDRLTQDDVNLVLSHLNSYIRKQYDDKPAITRFSSIYGDEILKELGITLIDPNDVMMTPELLRGKI